MTTLDEFLKALDAIGNYCESKQDNEDGRDCCDNCILTKICLDIPVRSTFEASVRAAQEAIELISKEEAANEKV